MLARDYLDKRYQDLQLSLSSQFGTHKFQTNLLKHEPHNPCSGWKTAQNKSHNQGSKLRKLCQHLNQSQRTQLHIHKHLPSQRRHWTRNSCNESKFLSKLRS
mmetsp:Transcript_17457/g.31532  ORF Transcript_17457/g.31532 Transcript_17457/m.31532 type:complete len:102 (-) Transcript_17457:48-353(-)